MAIFAVAIALKKDALGVGGKHRRGHYRIAGAMLAQCQFTLDRAHQQKHIRGSLAAAGADEYAGITVAIEGYELTGIGDEFFFVGHGRTLADILQLFRTGREIQIQNCSSIGRP